jgi:ATP/ADP translocase
MNYNHNLLTTYQFYDPKLRCYCNDKYDIEDVIEFEDMADQIYQMEFLEIFGLKDVENLTDNLVFNETFENLFNILYSLPEICEFVEKIIKKHIPDLPEFVDEAGNTIDKKEHIIKQAFAILFSYQYFFMIHKCVCDLNTCGELLEETKMIIAQYLNK